MNKIFDILIQFSNAFALVIGALLFAVAGSAEGMILCGVAGAIVFCIELVECIDSYYRKKCRDKNNESKKAARE